MPCTLDHCAMPCPPCLHLASLCHLVGSEVLPQTLNRVWVPLTGIQEVHLGGSTHRHTGSPPRDRHAGEACRPGETGRHVGKPSRGPPRGAWEDTPDAVPLHAVLPCRPSPCPCPPVHPPCPIPLCSPCPMAPLLCPPLAVHLGLGQQGHGEVPDVCGGGIGYVM